jgi:DNA mismatch repair protein MutS
LQVGSFWELYWYCDDDVVEHNTDGSESARFAVAVMGLTVTRNTKKETVSLKNPYMSGFPMAGPDKWNLLLDVGWTVVLARQSTADDNTISRELSECMSPSMRTDNAVEQGNYACCVYVNERKNKCDVGVALIDVSTGFSVAMDVLKSCLLDCVSVIAPVIASRTVSEVILIGSEIVKGSVCGLLGCVWKHGTYVHDQMTKWDREAIGSAYGDNVLQKAFGDDVNRKTLHLCTRQYACDALIYLLHFTRQHMIRMSTHLPFPQILEPSGFVNFSMYAIQQLGVPQLLNVINRTVTPMGRRLFQARVMAPSCIPNEIRDRLDSVSNVLDIDASNDHIISVRKALRNVGDVQRWARKARQNDIAIVMADTFQDVVKRASDIADVLNVPHIASICRKWTSAMQGVCTGDDSDLMFPDLELATELSKAMSEKNAEIEDIRNAIHPSAKLVDRDRLEVTVVRWASVPDAVKDRVVAVQMKNRMRVSDPTLCVAWDAYTILEKELSVVQSSEWSRIVGSGDFDGLNTVADWLADVDVTYTAALLARSGISCKPIILEGETAMIQTTSLGNVMAENALQNYSNEEYVRNDVSLDDETSHILLYGINSSGKSTILRGVGLSIIMVQAGLYAPCRSMYLCPFKRIDTRILTPDNIEKGLSSFTAEVHEMREALRAAGPRSLLLADELCNSTEHKSATALVGVLIKSIGEKGTKSFITTHFHELLEHPNLKDMSTLRVQHMSMRTDPVHGLIYERRLSAGPCEPDYGVLVAASLGFDAKFIREATQARESFCAPAYTKVTKSRYNKKVILNVCELCKRAPAQETHHIKHRAHAVDGMHDDMSENARSNLMPLCNECHKRVHKEHSTLVRVHTLNGPLIIQS